MNRGLEQPEQMPYRADLVTRDFEHIVTSHTHPKH